MSSKNQLIWRKSFPGILFFVSLIPLVLLSLAKSLELPTYHLDGAFQTASGEYRLKDLQFPGRDFFPYLGTGPILLIFPFFILAGGNLFASVFASHLTTYLIFLISSFFVYLCCFKKYRPFTVIALFVFLVLICCLDSSNIDIGKIQISKLINVGFGEWINPGNSLRPLRASLAYAAGITIWSVINLNWSVRVKMLAAGCALGGLTSVWSNDYALPTLTISVIFICFWGLRQRIGIQYLMYFLLSLFCSYILVGQLITSGNLLSLVKYNLDVAGDQFWYFGPWSRETRIFSVWDLLNALNQQGIFFHVVVLGLLFSTCRLLSVRLKFDYNFALLLVVGLILFSGGLVATLGGHSGPYFLSFRRWAYMVDFVLFYKIMASRGIPVLGSDNPLWRKRLIALRNGKSVRDCGVLLISGLSIFSLVFSSYLFSNEFSRLSNSSDFYHEAKLGGFLDTNFIQLKTLKGSLFEEYFGVAGTFRGPNKALKVDSVIHALGHQREIMDKYLASQPPHNVITTNPLMTSAWSSWNISANYFLYRELFTKYVISNVTKNTITWTPSPPPRRISPISCKVKDNKVYLGVSSPKLLQITLTSDMSGLSRGSFYMIRNNINTPESANGYLALNPHKEIHEFPVLASSRNHILDVKVISNKKNISNKVLSKCRAGEIVLTDNLKSTYGKYFKWWFYQSTGEIINFK
jgi:hypothetical protein